jgi:cysteine synthase
VITIDDAAAFETCLTLAREEGLLAGGSSGRRRGCARVGGGSARRTVVTIFPDGAERYPGQGILEK